MPPPPSRPQVQAAGWARPADMWVTRGALPQAGPVPRSPLTCRRVQHVVAFAPLSLNPWSCPRHRPL